jgi:hypothetical protein
MPTREKCRRRDGQTTGPRRPEETTYSGGQGGAGTIFRLTVVPEFLMGNQLSVLRGARSVATIRR